MNTLRFDLAREAVSGALDVMITLEGVEWDDTSKNDPVKAGIARSLNHAADMLMLASTLVRNEYWVGKGFDDPTAVTD